MSDTTAPDTRQVLFRGHVQGVFFRKTAAKFARSFQVTGFVRNLPDGSVELVAQGQPAEIDGLVNALVQHYSNNVTDVTQQRLADPLHLTGFEIRY